MAQLGFFDPNSVKDDRELIPDGTYLAQIVDSDVVPTKAGNGSFLKLKWQLMTGLEGRVVFDQVTVENQNDQARHIGAVQLKRLCAAIGSGAIQDSAQLHMKPCFITIGIKPGSGQYGPRNVVKAYAHASGAAAAAPVASSATAPSPPPQHQGAAAAQQTRRPWEG